jgi:PKD repeat protein
MMKYLLSLSFLCLSVWLFSQNPTGMKVIPERIYNMEKSAWSFEEVQPFQNLVGPERLDIPIELSLDAWGLQPDMTVLANIANNKPAALDVVIPVLNGPSMVVRVYRVEITAEDMKTEYASGRTHQGIPGAFYRGIVKGDYQTLVALSFYDDHVRGMLMLEDRTLVLGPLEGASNQGVHILYDDDLIAHRHTFSCGTDELNHDGVPKHDPLEIKDRSPGDCVNVYWEVNYNIWQDKGAGTLNYITGATNEVFTLYDNDGITAATSQILIWDEPSPYPGPSSGNFLSQFRDHLSGNYNGDIAHLLGYGGGGGVAYLDVLCDKYWSVAYSGIAGSYKNVPTYSWTVMVMSHEMGHNLGSPHTHDCAWNGNNTRIDNCGGNAGYPSGNCNNSPPDPAAGGTVMSYCHLRPVGINLGEGFGPQPSALMIGRINSANCLGNCYTAEPPYASFSASENGGCLPLTINFVDESGNNPTSWNWTFPGGTPGSSTMQNPTVTYNTKGSWNVTLTVTNPVGSDTHTEQGFIDVNDKPINNFEFIQDENIVSFINFHEGGTSFYWEFGDSKTSTEENPVHVYEEDGTYEVILSVSNECGTTSHNVFIDVVTTPFADFVSDVQRGCAPLTVNFEDMSSENTTAWQWLFPGGTPDSSKVQNPVVVYNQPGTYTVSLTASNAAGQRTEVKTGYITVLAFPGQGFDYNVQIDSVFFNPLGAADSLFWDFGDGAQSKDSTPVHVYTEEGVYTVSLSMFTECGDSTFTRVVTIVFPPVAGFSAGNTQGCAPLTVQFNDESSESTTNWAWTFDGGNPGTSAEQNPEVVYETAGTYSVTLIVTNPLGNDTIQQDDIVVILGGPQAGFNAAILGKDVTFANESEDGDTYAWDFGDGATSTDENPNHTYETNGTYQVTLIVTNGCGSDTFSQEVIIDVSGQDAPEFLEIFEVFPNPNNGKFVIHLEGVPTASGIRIDIVDVLGRQIYADKLDFSASSLKHTIQLPETAAGAHFLRLWHNGKAFTRLIQVINR